MSENNEKGILQQLKQQHAQFCAQRDQTQINYQQLVGAIFACETMIKKHEESLKKAVEKLAQDVTGNVSSIKPNENQEEIENGEVNSKKEKQTA